MLNEPWTFRERNSPDGSKRTLIPSPSNLVSAGIMSPHTRTHTHTHIYIYSYRYANDMYIYIYAIWTLCIYVYIHSLHMLYLAHMYEYIYILYHIILEYHTICLSNIHMFSCISIAYLAYGWQMNQFPAPSGVRQVPPGFLGLGHAV